MTESGGKLVLVADDDERVCELLSDALAMRGFRAVCVREGTGVLPAVLTHRPDLIILDVLLPGRDGYAICREIKSHPALAAIPVVMFSVKDAQEDRLAGLQAGAIDFIPKPFYIASLLNKIEYLLSRSD